MNLNVGGSVEIRDLPFFVGLGIGTIHLGVTMRKVQKLTYMAEEGLNGPPQKGSQVLPTT